MATTQTTDSLKKSSKQVEELHEVVIRFAGDSGDGMQLAGTQFSRSSAIFGNDVCTFPDYPAEIRAPVGTLAGVSGFQVNFSSHPINTPGDKADVLVAFNPAALKTGLPDVRPGGLLVVNEDAFGTADLRKAGYDSNPLEDDSLAGYQLFKVPVSRLNQEALADSTLGSKQVSRCKNFFALGLICWLYGRPLEPSLGWIDEKFGKNPAVAIANKTVLKAGYFFGETCELIPNSYQVPKASLTPGRYRRVSGNQAVSLGLIAAAHLADKELFFGAYPITPASDIMHLLAQNKHHRIKTFQAEDEIAAIAAAIGASFAGDLAATGTSGPGLALKGEALGLAVMTELPLVLINVQRGGPSTGLPTKTEQSDLLQAMFGRHGECPLCVMAAGTPAGCFDAVIQATRIAFRYKTPVILLTDGYVANGEEPWRVPDLASYEKIEANHPKTANSEEGFMPYLRDEHLSRPWALPGTPGLQHRIGGLEKADVTGQVSYDPQNHAKMVEYRAKKIENIVEMIPDQQVLGPESGDLLVMGWGGTTGAILSAVSRAQQQGLSVAGAVVEYLSPFPANLGEVLKRYRRVLIPELNRGQLRFLIRANFGVEAEGLNKVEGKPFLVSEIESGIQRIMTGGNDQ